MKNKLFVFMIDALCEFDVSYMRTLPNFGSILERGALVEEMLPVYPSFTYPCHVSIMTGCYPDRHGIPHNEMVQAGGAVDPKLLTGIEKCRGCGACSGVCPSRHALAESIRQAALMKERGILR